MSDPFLSDVATITVIVTDIDEPDTQRFSDVPVDHVFFDEIEWLASQGITAGCNPPANDRYCPDSSVTRGQAAAFLHRALATSLEPVTVVEFIDDDDSIFEEDIEWLGSVGVTRGCNPPANDRFCPDLHLTRAEMAALLVRALGLTGPTDAEFIDDDGSIFENDIEQLAGAGITKGCNPPINDRFCPSDTVTRGQMAAFLYRALGR